MKEVTNTEKYDFQLLDCEAGDWFHVHNVAIDTKDDYEYQNIISSADLSLCCLLNAAPELLAVCESLLANADLEDLHHLEKQKLKNVIAKAKGENLRFIEGKAVFSDDCLKTA